MISLAFQMLVRFNDGALFHLVTFIHHVSLYIIVGVAHSCKPRFKQATQDCLKRCDVPSPSLRRDFLVEGVVRE